MIIRAESSGAHAIVVQLEGDVDVESAREVRERLFGVLDDSPDGTRLMVIDLSGAAFLDSSGLGALVATSNRARARGCRVFLADPTPIVTRVLEMSALDKVWPIYPTVPDALADLPSAEPA